MTGIETVAIWIAGKTVGALVEPVLKSLAQDIAKDIAKDKSKGFINKYLGQAANLIPHDDFVKTYGKVIRELVDTIDEELRNVGVAAHDTVAWTKDIQAFVKSETVRDELVQAFTSSTGGVNGNSLRLGWQLLTDITPLSPEFDWASVAKNFNRKLRELRANDTDFRAVLQAQAAVETAENTKRSAGLQPKSDLNAYREALLERYANLHFDTLDTTGAFETKRQLWNIFVAQTVRDCQEYRPQDMEIPKEHQRRLRERGEWNEIELREEMLEMRRRNYLDQVPRSVLEAVNDDRLQRLVILGDPGSGKSSLLHYLALEWARIPDAAAREAAPLPLLIELREYNNWDCPSGKSFVRYLHDAQNWYRLDQLQIDQRLSNQSGAILLLDGLDEIFDPARHELAVNDITRFSNEYSNIKIIVTSRVIGYKQQRLSDAEFSHVMLQDLEEPQIYDFLECWHNETFDPNRTDREAKKVRLAKAIGDSRAIRELAGNPLLLTMMAILNRHQELPRDRARLYEQASRVLLHEWDTERTLESHPQLKGIIGHQEKAEMLRDIAYFMQSNATGQVGNIIARGDLERLVREYLQKTLGLAQPHALAKALVEQLRERNFILCFLGANSYAFVHRTFLEYFCASAIVREFRKNLSLDYLKDEVFGKHWHDETWHEVLCLIAGMLAKSSADHIVQIILFLVEKSDSWYYRNIFLATKCAKEMRMPQQFRSKLDTLKFKLEYLTNLPDLYWDQAIGRVTTTETSHPAYQHLSQLEEFEFTWHYVPMLRDAAFAFLVNSQLLDDTYLWLKANARTNSDSFIRIKCITELFQHWKEKADTSYLLKQSFWDHNEAKFIREQAKLFLLQGWETDPDVIAWWGNHSS